VASAFIIQVQSGLQPDPNEETAALLRVLIYKIDNTTFGSNVPTVPQWSGPPHSIIQVQAILYASLAASLLSAFLAMLGKQWLNRYVSVDMRGSTIERSQNRQRKLNGIIAWYFNHILESLPLMLQAALLLLSCALSRYLWEINTTIALVIIAVTSFGFLFYLFIIAAGTASVTCPYQTPGASILRHILHRTLPHILQHTLPHILGRLRRASHTFLDYIRGTFAYYLTVEVWRQEGWDCVIPAIYMLPIGLVVDTYHLGRSTALLLIVTTRRLYVWLPSQLHPLTQGLDMLDLDCISWTLQTSLDKVVHQSTLEYLATMTTLAECDPSLVLACFNTLISCVKVTNTHVEITPGLEQFARLSAAGFVRTFSHLMVVDQSSSGFSDIRWQYQRVFPQEVNFSGIPLSYTFGMVHSVFYPEWRTKWIYKKGDNTSSQEYLMVISTIIKLAQSEYQVQRKVPRWILHFALHSLSQEHLSPTSVIGCLSIIAIDLGCYSPSTRPTTLDERCV